jgi:hypothetical protein
VFSGSAAFEATPSGVAWVSTNLGRDWIRLEAPPAFYPLDERTALQTLGPAPRIGCSHTGCVYGAWAHVGFPESSAEVTMDAGAASSDEEPRSEAPNGTQTLAEAEVPKRVQFNPTSFSEWKPACHSTGRMGAAPAELERRLNQTANERPRRGMLTGFLPPLLLQHPLEVGGAVFRPLAGIEGPKVGKATVRFDEGRDGEPRFRAYAWANGASQWTSSAAWQVRVESVFDLDGVCLMILGHLPLQISKLQ